MTPLAKKVVLEWYKDMSHKMAKDYEWGCPICHRVYEKQTQAQRCCGYRKIEDFDEHWLSRIKPGTPIGFYYETPEDYEPFKTVYNRWLDFTTRLIKQMKCTEAREEKLLDEAGAFIGDFDPDGNMKYDIVGWDYKILALNYYFCDHIGDYFNKYRIYNEHGEQTGKFCNQLYSAIRAGLDVVIPEPMVSAGVIGFTIGDLRKMYPEGLPDWFPIKIDTEISDDEPIWL